MYSTKCTRPRRQVTQLVLESSLLKLESLKELCAYYPPTSKRPSVNIKTKNCPSGVSHISENIQIFPVPALLDYPSWIKHSVTLCGKNYLCKHKKCKQLVHLSTGGDEISAKYMVIMKVSAVHIPNMLQLRCNIQSLESLMEMKHNICIDQQKLGSQSSENNISLNLNGRLLEQSK